MATGLGIPGSVAAFVVMFVCVSKTLHVRGRNVASTTRTIVSAPREVARTLVRPTHAPKRKAFTKASLVDPPSEEKKKCTVTPVLQEIGIPAIEVPKVLEIAAVPLDWEVDPDKRILPPAPVITAEWEECTWNYDPDSEECAEMEEAKAQLWNSDSDAWKTNITKLYKYLQSINLTRR